MTSKPTTFTLSDDRIRPTVARISLWVGDIARSEAFYSGVFGFERLYTNRIETPGIVESWHFPPGTQMDIVLLKSPRGETEIGLSAIPGALLPKRPTVRYGTPFAGTPYLVLYVPSLDAVLAKIDPDRAINRPAKRLYDSEGRCFYEAAIYDPDDTVLLVVEDIKSGATGD